MKKQILVPLQRNDRLEDLLPYVEKVARSGMKVVFMVPYPVDGFRWSHEEIGRRAIEEGKHLASYYTWDANLRKARELVTPAVEALSTKGVDVGVELYAGNMQRALREFAAKSELHLIMSRASIGQRIAALLSGRNSLFDLLKRPSFSPVLLINPVTVA
jgi:hypothetical protein